MNYFIALSVLVVCVTGRVVDDSAVFNLNELLKRANPLDNEVAFEPRLEQEEEVPSVPNPALHILQSFSRPLYVDASVFRNAEGQSPIADINRQLTIMSASKNFQPPEPVLPEERGDQNTFRPPSFVPFAAPLFRENLQFKIEELEEDESLVADESPAVIFPETTGTEEQLEYFIHEKETVPHAPPAEEPQPPKEIKSALQKEEPLTHSLSPLSHILTGFGGEFGAFGGDHTRDRFISSFRPEDF